MRDEKVQAVEGPEGRVYFPMDSVCRLLGVQDGPELQAEMGEDGWGTGLIASPEGVSGPVQMATWTGLRTLLRNRPVLLIERPNLAELLKTLEASRA